MPLSRRGDLIGFALGIATILAGTWLMARRERRKRRVQKQRKRKLVRRKR